MKRWKLLLKSYMKIANILHKIKLSAGELFTGRWFYFYLYIDIMKVKIVVKVN